MTKPRQDPFKRTIRNPLKPGTRITDVRKQTRFGIIKSLTSCGYHVEWRGEKDRWIVGNFARELFLCSDSLAGTFFYLTEKQLDDAVKADPTPGKHKPTWCDNCDWDAPLREFKRKGYLSVKLCGECVDKKAQDDPRWWKTPIKGTQV